MTQYADYARLRSDTVPVQAPAASMSISMSVPPARMTIARRSLLDLPMAANSGSSTPASASSSAPGASPLGSASNAAEKRDADAMRPAAETSAASTDTDFDLSSTFDVPAFLRRQEG